MSSGGPARELVLARTLVELADTLVADFDVVDLLSLLVDRSVEVLAIDAAGLMLADPSGELRVMASSNEALHTLELFELQTQDGPCLDCYRTGEAVGSDDLAADTEDRWPQFRPRALAAGFRFVQAVPMRLRGTIIGALNLFCLGAGRRQDLDIAAAQALADVATIAVLQHRAVLEAQRINEQLTSALNSRVVIEQAKGVIAERTGSDMAEAFARLRRYARDHNQLLVDVARQVIDGSLT